MNVKQSDFKHINYTTYATSRPANSLDIVLVNGKVSPSLLPLGQEEGGCEVLVGVDGAIPAYPHLLRPPGGLKLPVGARV